MVDSFDEMFQSWISGPPSSNQAIVADFMDEGHFSTHIRLMRRIYKARHQALCEASLSLPACLKLIETTSGFHTPAFLSPNVNENEAVKQALEKGIILAPLNRYCISPIKKNGLVFGFGSTSPEDIFRGISIIRYLPALCKNWSD